jgi:hypothetical protein
MHAGGACRPPERVDHGLVTGQQYAHVEAEATQRGGQCASDVGEAARLDERRVFGRGVEDAKRGHRPVRSRQVSAVWHGTHARTDYSSTGGVTDE